MTSVRRRSSPVISRGLPSVVFGIQGCLNNMKIEFIDFTNKVVSARLLNITNSMQYYTVDVGLLSGLGLRVDRIQMISFVVDSNLVGAANLSGHFDVFTAGLTNPPKSYPQTDLTGGGLPDAWKEKYGWNPHDTNFIYGPLGDWDGDGANNSNEYVAGTSPIDINSAPLLDIVSNGKTNAVLSIDGFARRGYRFYRTDNLRTGTWTRVGPYKFVDNLSEPVQYLEDLSLFTNMFYRCLIVFDEVTRIVGRSQIAKLESNTDIAGVSQISASEFTCSYLIRTGYWAGVSMVYDDFDLRGVFRTDVRGFRDAATCEL